MIGPPTNYSAGCGGRARARADTEYLRGEYLGLFYLLTIDVRLIDVRIAVVSDLWAQTRDLDQ